MEKHRFMAGKCVYMQVNILQLLFHFQAEEKEVILMTRVHNNDRNDSERKEINLRSLHLKFMRVLAPFAAVSAAVALLSSQRKQKKDGKRDKKEICPDLNINEKRLS